MALGRTGHGDGELVTELLTDKLHQLSGIVQVAAGAFPAEGQVAAQSQHMVDAVIQIVLQLLTDAFLGVADAGKVSDGRALAVLLDLVQNLQIFAHVGAARAVGAGDVVGVQGVQLVQDAVLAAQLLHADVGLGGEHLKGKCSSLAENVLHAHKLPP